MVAMHPVPRWDTTGTAPETREIWTLRLWGLRSPALDRAATLATLVGLLASRLLLLPSGPWEWDETLFARGILRFDLHAHFPHPPGFPLWILAGKLLLPLVGDPLRGLQILSSLASCATLWPLTALGRRAAARPLATVASLAVLFAPGVWLHAVRGFSSTPASFFAAWAVALAVWGLEGRRVTAFTLLVTASFLVRPILLPPLALLWLLGVARARPRHRLFPGVAAALAAVGVAIAAMAAAQGSWARFVEAFISHGRTHAHNLASNVGGLTDLGIVKGLGGVWLASAILVLAMLGAFRWARVRGISSAAGWAAVIGVGIAQIVWLQNRTFPRYAVPFQLALAPLAAAGAAAAAPVSASVAGFAALGAFFATTAAPLLAEQRSRFMPGWQAVVFAAREAERRNVELVVEGGLYPFLSYLEEVDRSHGHRWTFPVHLAPSSPDATTSPEGPYLLVTDFPGHYLPAPFGRAWPFEGVSQRLRPFTQQRFLHCAVAEGVPLPLRGWWGVERDRTGVLSMWGGVSTLLLLPPYPTGTALELDISPADGPAPVVVSIDGLDVLRIPGRRQRQRVWLPAEAITTGKSCALAFTRAEGYHERGDPRLLALRLFGIRAVGSRLPWAVSLADGPARERFRIRAEGLFPPEDFSDGRGAWTTGRATLWLPAEGGSVFLTTWAPRPIAPTLEAMAGGRRIFGPVKVPRRPTELEIVVPLDVAAEHGVELELRVWPTTNPAREGHGGDRRELGVVLGAARFEPGTRAQDESVRWPYDAD